MRAAWFKYLLVFVCLFSILERTGIANALINNVTAKYQSRFPAPADGEEDDANTNNTKEVELKEYWAITHSQLAIAVLSVAEQSAYQPYQKNHHLGWVPPVPTPPPNRF